MSDIEDKWILNHYPQVNKATAMAMGVSAEGFDSIKGVPEIEKTGQAFSESFKEIKEAIAYYVDMSPQSVHMIALWILGTYIHSAFSAFPYLFLNAMRGSAKTRTLGIISHLAHKGNGRVHVGINERVLYRSEEGATLVLDECEQIGKKQKEELREYLNAGYKQGITVSRSKKVKTKGKDKDEETYVQEEFRPYRPISMANIWGMEEVLGDRCITLILEKSNKPEFVKIIEDFSDNPVFQKVKVRLIRIQCILCMYLRKKNYIHLWNLYVKNTYIHTLHTLATEDTQVTQDTLNPEIPEELLPIFKDIYEADIDGRNLELFLPLLIVSLLLGQEVFKTTLGFAKEMVRNKKTEELSESKDVSFLEYIASQNSGLEYVSIKDIAQGFKAYLNPDDEERWLSHDWIGRALRRLSLASAKRRVSRGSEVILNIAHAQEKLKMFKTQEKP